MKKLNEHDWNFFGKLDAKILAESNKKKYDATQSDIDHILKYIEKQVRKIFRYCDISLVYENSDTMMKAYKVLFSETDPEDFVLAAFIVGDPLTKPVIVPADLWSFEQNIDISYILSDNKERPK